MECLFQTNKFGNQINKSKIKRFLDYSKIIASHLGCSLLFFSSPELENKYLLNLFSIKEDFALLITAKSQKDYFNDSVLRKDLGNKPRLGVFSDDKFDGNAFNNTKLYPHHFSTTLFLPFVPQKNQYCQKKSVCLIDSIKELRSLIPFLKTSHLNKPKHNIGVEFERMRASEYLNIKGICPLIDIGAYFDSFFSVKDGLLLAKISKSALLTDLVFKRLYLAIKTSKIGSEHGAYEFINYTVKRLGLEPAFSPIVANALNSANIHHLFPSKKPFKKGFILVDLGVKYEGLCSDMTRMMYLGRPNPKEMELFNLVKSVLEKSIDFVRKGMFYSDIDDYARKQFGSYTLHFTHLLGHGLGYNVHEGPSFSKNSKDTVKKNQVFTIEPGIYLKGKFGIRIEDSCYFDGKKAVTLTKTKRDLLLV